MNRIKQIFWCLVVGIFGCAGMNIVFVQTCKGLGVDVFGPALALWFVFVNCGLLATVFGVGLEHKPKEI